MKKSRKRRYWQCQPCPSWCGTRHREHDLVGDRECLSKLTKTVTLSLHGPVVRTSGEHHVATETPDLVVYLKRKFREREARITVEAVINDGVSRFEFTTSEADQVGRALLKAVELGQGRDMGGARA